MVQADEPETGRLTKGTPTKGRPTSGGRIGTAIATIAVVAAILTPNDLNRITAVDLLRLPVELVAVGALLALSGGRAGRLARLALGALLGLLLVVKIADMAAFQAFARPFDPVLDWHLLDAAMNLLTGAVGRGGALAAAGLAAVSAVLLVLLLAWSADRLGAALARRRTAVLATAGAGFLLWSGLAIAGASLGRGVPLASADTAALAASHARQVRASLNDRAAFAAESAVDRFRDLPPDRLFAALRGKDVMVIFVESYGRTVVDDPLYAPAVEKVLADGDARLKGAGLGVRSGWLKSPTVGGQSWLAHGTLLSGLWIGNQLRYDTLVTSSRMTLNAAFRKAGWRTVAALPAITMPWPEGAFFGYDRVYAARDLGYRGRPFNWVTMPDQFTLSALQRLERDVSPRPPLMAEVALISSHAPWTPIPTRIPWADVGDGRVFDAMAESGDPPSVVWQDADRVRLQFRLSVEYAMDVVVSYAETFGSRDLVLIVLGDHQPAPIITGPTENRDVPVHVIAGDPAVLDRFAAWGWTPSLRPAGDLPSEPMSGFRDRFIETFSDLGD